MDTEWWRRQVADRIVASTLDLAPPVAATITRLVDRPGRMLRGRMHAASHVWRPDPDVVLGAAVVELIHLGTLLHDDVIDRADVRRGVPSAHVAHSPAVAAVAGACCIVAAIELDATTVRPDAGEVDLALADLVEGERRDVERAFDLDVDDEEVLDISRLKTGALFSLAAALALPPGDHRRSPRRAFGREFGAAYQVLDDCLALVPHPGEKSADVDLLHGIYGAPTLIAARSTTVGPALRRLLADRDVVDLPRTTSLVLRGGGVDTALEMADAAMDRALQHLDAGDPADAALGDLARRSFDEARRRVA